VLVHRGKAKLLGSAKGPNGWMRIDTANVYYDHPFHAPLDHALGIDFINEAEAVATRGVGIERAVSRATWSRGFSPLCERRSGARQGDASLSRGGGGGIGLRHGTRASEAFLMEPVSSRTQRDEDIAGAWTGTRLGSAASQRAAEETP